MICKKCNNYFPIKVEIDGEKHNLSNRKFCLECSPWGKHNTLDLNKEQLKNKTYKKKRIEYTKTCPVCDNIFTGTDGSNLCCSCKNKVRRLKCKMTAVEYLGGKCQRCGWTGDYAAYEFHHLDPSKKEFTIGRISNKKWEVVRDELDKCELLCSICHRIEHSERDDPRLLEWAKNQIRPYHFTDNYERSKQQLGTGVCLFCRENFDKKEPEQLYCNLRCFGKSKKSPNRPTKEVLESLLWEKPTTQIALDYGVSDKAIEKWSKQYELTKPPRGYWQKQKINVSG